VLLQEQEAWEMKLLFSVLLVLGALFVSSCFFEELTKPGDVGDNWSVTSITNIKEYGKSVDWLPAGNLVASARMLYDEYYDVIIFSMDDPAGETWLTHEVAGVPQKHNGNPAWHPSGEYLVFTAENEDVPDIYDEHAIPGKGVNCNLWVARADGSEFGQLTEIETAVLDAQGVIHPQFSPDGSRLLWAERVGEDASAYWGRWVLKVAQFEDNGVDLPGLGDVETFDPAVQSGFYESHAFSHDGEEIMFTGNIMEGQHELGMDICTMNLQTENLTRLTTTFADWDEHAHWSPDGGNIVWMSSAGLDIDWPEDMGPDDWRYYLATELWIMNSDGSNQQRLTYYNEPDHPHNQAPRTVVSDSAWSPGGGSLIVLVAHYDGTGPASTAYTELVLIELSKE